MPGECCALIGCENGGRDDIPDLSILEIIEWRQHLVSGQLNGLTKVFFGEELKERTSSKINGMRGRMDLLNREAVAQLR